MNILHISTEKKWRGGENQLCNLLSQSDPTKYKHHILLHKKANFSERFKALGTVHLMAMLNDLDLFSAWRIARLCLKNNIQIIHAHTAKGHGLAILSKKIANVFGLHLKLIVHRRVEQSSNLSWIRRKKYISGTVDHYIAVSKAISEGLVNIGVPAAKISVIYSSIDESPYINRIGLRPISRRNLLIGDQPSKNQSKALDLEQPIIFCFIGAVEPLKGVHDLIAAWENLLSHLHSKGLETVAEKCRLFIVGEGSLLEELKLKKPRNTQFLGFRKDVSQILCGCDVLVLPTHWEGLGSILIDGALAGAALIGSNVGGVPEIIENEVTGLLTPVSDLKSLEHAMYRCLDLPFRKSLAETARPMIKSKFSVSRMIDQTQRVYRKISGQ
ncbi:MAG: glycosyltransferase family 4 protein [Proteobacteria bacterium]|nr:glycosyltransferase family 4 protein [Pseudomonadota bacterium]